MPTQQLRLDIDTGDEIYFATELSLVTDRYNTAAELKTQVTERGISEADFETGDTVKAFLNGELVFTGDVTDAKSNGPIAVDITAYDAVRQLKTNNITQSFGKAPISAIARTACEEAGVQHNINLPNNVTSAEFADTNCAKVVEEMARFGDAVWYVDNLNVVNVTTSPDVTAHPLTNDRQDPRGVLDTSAGKTQPPYQSVKVYGTSPASRDGVDSIHLFSSEPVVATAGFGEPQYTVINENIRTQKVADQVATSILKEFEKQQQGGYVKTVAAPEIRPYDVIRLPQRLGGESYLVASIEHTVDNNNGGETRINCGGLVSPETGGNNAAVSSGDSNRANEERVL